MKLIVLFLLMVTNLANANALHFSHSPKLNIDSQDVTISPNAVSIDYTFNNSADQDVTENFAFALPLDSPEAIKQFIIMIDGTPIKHQLRQRALNFNGADITIQLKELNLPINPVAAMHSLDSSINREMIVEKLRAKELLTLREDTPNWLVQTVYFWQHTFPANSITKVQQSYKITQSSKKLKIPSANGIIKTPVNIVKKIFTLAVRWTLADDNAATHLQAQLEKIYPQIHSFCPSKEDYRRLASNMNSNFELQAVSCNLADSIIEPAISEFSLKIIYPDDTYPLTCWQGTPTIEQNILTYSVQNYVPLQNVEVLYLSN